MKYKKKMLRNEYFMTSLEESIAEDDIVRVIDALVDKLDLEKLGLVENERKSNAGCSKYDARDLLKIYIYGYRRGIHSGRKLEDICKYDIRFQWLVGKLQPDANTLNDFRKNNKELIENAFYEINRMYIKLGILKLGTYSQDGFKIKAVNSKEKNYTKNKIIDRIKREEKGLENQNNILETLEREQEKVEEYLNGLEINEEIETKEEELRILEENINKAKEEIEEVTSRKTRHEDLLKEMNDKKISQISLTDPDSRLMKNNGKFDVAYNNQTAVDVETHLTIAIETDNNPADVGSMGVLADKIRENYKGDAILTNLTDKGYQNRKDMADCLEKGVIPQVTPRDKNTDYVEITLEYEENEISKEDKKSRKKEDIKKCLRAGEIPECYDGIIEDISVETSRKYKTTTEEDEEEKEPETTAEIEERAMQEQKFIYDENTKTMICPQGEHLCPKSKRENGSVRFANKMACKNCKNQCTKSKYKEVELRPGKKEVKLKGGPAVGPREGIKKKLETQKIVKVKLKIDNENLKRRMSTSEHSQGTMKIVDNYSSFCMRGKDKVSTEIALHFIASNIRRVSNMISSTAFLKKIEELKTMA